MSDLRNVRVEMGQPYPLDHVGKGPRGVLVTTPFREDFVHELKAMVPWEERAWDSEDRVWWVEGSHADRVIDLVVHHFGETVVVHPDGGEEYRTSAGTVARQERLL